MIPILQKKRLYKVIFLVRAQMIRLEKPLEKAAVAAGANVKVVADLDEAYAWLGVEGRGAYRSKRTFQSSTRPS
jgi:hypothetical protein